MEDINDIISKSRLLFNYDTKKTLTENIESRVLLEGKGQGFANALADAAHAGKLTNIMSQAFGKLEGAQLKMLIPDKKTGKLVEKVFQSTDVNKVINAFKSGAKLGAKEQTALSKALMKTPLEYGSSLRRTLTDKAADLASKSDEYKNLSKNDIAKRLRGKGYDPELATEIANKADDLRGGSKKKFKPDPSKPDPLNPDPSKPNKPNTPDPKTDPKTLTNKDLEGIKSILGKHWEYIKEMYKQGKTLAQVKKWAVRLGLGLGAVYLLWKWLGKDNGCNPLTEIWDGTKCIPIPPVPVPVTCPSGTVWNGSSCVRKGGGGGTTFTNCTDFPYTKGCQSSIISEVQKCLGLSADGKFGSQTQQALIKGGYGTEITKEVYDKIKQKCGSNTTPIVDPNTADPGSEQYTETGYNDL